ncbi:MAG: cell division protein FtsZ, partial [Caulobacter sp.]|nr:cell division protein FtsZ [Caulobacter sp.]
FADVRTVMTEMGKAMMGTGEATGEDRALMAAQNAIQNPLLDEVSLKGAKAVLVNVTGGLDMTLLEVDEAANAITDQVDPEANVIFGAAFDPALEGSIRVSVVATGMDGASIAAIEPARPQRVNATARPLIVADLQPSPIQAPAPEPVQTFAAQPVYEQQVRPFDPAAYRTPGPDLLEPELTFEAEQADLGFEAPTIRTQPPVITPPAQHTMQIETPRTVIVDPLVAEDDDVEAPLYTDPHFDDSRQQRKGFLSLFGGRQQQQQRYDGPPAMRTAARPTGGAAPQMMEEPQTEEGEDLEIPSFLRRLAN